MSWELMRQLQHIAALDASTRSEDLVIWYVRHQCDPALAFPDDTIYVPSSSPTDVRIGGGFQFESRAAGHANSLLYELGANNVPAHS